MIKDLWYKNAVIYCLSVATYMDTNGDGIGAGSSEDSRGAAASAPLDLPQGIHIGLRVIEEVSREYRRPGHRFTLPPFAGNPNGVVVYPPCLMGK